MNYGMDKASLFRFPSLSERAVVVGRTGSGKTQFSAWLLSEARFDIQPYVIVDYKGDALLNDIPFVQDLSLDQFPRKPGLYRISPLPETDDEKVEAWLWEIWKREKIGLYVDEAYRIPDKGGAFNAILTQGRSKKIPVISCSQRPAWLSRFVFSEADFFAVFQLNDREDRLKVRRFLSEDGAQVTRRLPDFSCYWYDVKKDSLMIMSPVPDANTLLERFEQRLTPKRRFA